MRGRTKLPQSSLDMLSGYDAEEDLTLSTGGADINLAFGAMDDGVTSREGYYCRSVHNFGAAPAVIAYKRVGGSTQRKVYVQPGSDKHFWGNIGTIVQSASTNGATIKLYYKDRSIVDGSGPSGV